MFIGIDGTGKEDNTAYENEMRGGFIGELSRICPERNKKYFRGPTIEGAACLSIAYSALTLIKEWTVHGDKKILIAGYSRGGVIAIHIAKLLKEQDWSRSLFIECMALFDAVDRAESISGGTIPSNVAHAYHAIRDPAVGSRWYFGNCGTQIEGRGRLLMQRFFATHAGMGGVPWTGDHPTKGDFIDSGITVRTAAAHVSQVPAPTITSTQDYAESARVKQWMWGNIRKHGMVP